MSDSLNLSEYLQRQTFVTFDTETTGLWAPCHRVVEIGAVKFRLGDGTLGTFQSLIHPERSIPPEVIAIHGITDDMVATAPSVKPILQSFLQFSGADAILLAHNAPFDISFLSCELDRVSLAFPDNLILDTVDIFHRLYPELESYSLLSLAQSFGVAPTQEHRALADARLVQGLFIKAAARFGSIKSREDLTRMFTPGTLRDWPGLVGELPDEFGELNRALKEKRRVEIRYQSQSRSAQTRVIRPRQVFLLGKEFYINAYCERAHSERTFRLDRIEHFRVLD